MPRIKRAPATWDDLVEEGEAKHDDTPAEAGSGLRDFPLAAWISIMPQVTWDDRSSGQKFSVDQFSLKSGSITSGQPVALEMEMVLESSEPQLKAKIEMRVRCRWMRRRAAEDRRADTDGGRGWKSIRHRRSTR